MPKNILLEDYIKSLENPDSIGWDEKTQRWYEPTLPGYDKNQRGIGLDIRTNNDVAKHLREHPREGNYLTKEEEEYFRRNYLDHLNGIFMRHTKNFRVSDKKKIMAMGLMYHGLGPRLWSDNGDGLYNAFWNGDDEAFKQAISKFYDGRFSERKRAHDNFWKKQEQNTARFQNLRLVNLNVPPHIEKPDALRVPKPIVIGGYKQGGRLLPKKPENYISPYMQRFILGNINRLKKK